MMRGEKGASGAFHPNKKKKWKMNKPKTHRSGDMEGTRTGPTAKQRPPGGGQKTGAKSNKKGENQD